MFQMILPSTSTIVIYWISEINAGTGLKANIEHGFSQNSFLYLTTIF